MRRKLGFGKMAGVMRRWAKIRGAYVLTRRNVARIVAAIAAALLAFHTASAALSPADETLCRRASGAMVRALNLEDAMPSGVSRVAVSDHVFAELTEVFFAFRHLLPGPLAQPRTIAARRRNAPALATSFSAEDRRMLRQIYRASVFGETPSEAQVAGDVRRQQVLYGAKLYKPSSKHVKGVSSYRAAEKAIRAPQFHDVEGAYTLAERDVLARAIRREYKFPRSDFGT